MTDSDKTVWITGASSGIGEALAKAASAQGMAVILSGRREEALRVLASELGNQALVLPFEATAHDQLPDIVRTAWGWRGAVDLLINNAGISQRSLAIDTDFSVYRTLMEVNFFAPIQLTQLILPRMIERRSGHLAIVSSVAGKVGAPLRTGYSAAKHACIGYYDALRAEIETAYGLKVSVIMPGSVRTAIAINALSSDGTPRGRSDVNIEEGMTADRAASLILDGLAKNGREILIAEGAERIAVELRATNPETLFDVLGQEGVKLAAQRVTDGANISLDPSKISTLT